MTSYERIQRAIDYIEDHLTSPIELENVASAACFSPSHLYRMFHALAGHSIKEYIRKRRMSEAALRLVGTEDRLIDICLDYQFEYQESFTRAFKSMFGVTPGRFRRHRLQVVPFPHLNLLDKYFLTDPVNALDPRIKVLKKLEPIRVASFRAVSKTPEQDAWDTLRQWADGLGLLHAQQPYRVFGFDNPAPAAGNPEYGYEVWLTVGPTVTGAGEVRIKTFPGGLYAVTGTTVSEIAHAWRHFVNWLGISRYRPGSHQCLEEHLSPLNVLAEDTQIDLYLPVEEPLTQQGEMQ